MLGRTVDFGRSRCCGLHPAKTATGVAIEEIVGDNREEELTEKKEKAKSSMSQEEEGKRVEQNQTQQTRRCARFMGQNIKIVQKAEELTRKRNLEPNSFSVRSDEILVDKSSNMGVKISVKGLEIINVIRDLEIARHTLDGKRDLDSKVPAENDKVESPLVEQQLLGWHSELSDAEGFKVVSYKKSRRKNKKVSFCGNREKYLTSPPEMLVEEKESSLISSKTPPRKGRKLKKLK